MKSKREFDGGYCRTNQLPALFEARRQRAIGKNELRLFFAKLEHGECRAMAPIDVILNKNRKQKNEKGSRQAIRYLPICI